MTFEDELRRQLSDAASVVPIHGWSTDLKGRAVSRRRVLAALTVAAGVVAVAGAGAAASAVLHPDGGKRPMAAAPDAGYVGSGWRLTAITEGSHVTAIPAGLGARIDLMPDGRILLNDGVNAFSGRFTPTTAGFQVHEVGTTLVVYGGKDPAQLAAISAIATLAYGNPEGVTPTGPVQDVVTRIDGSRLVVRAGGYQLAFDRTGPATDTRPDKSAAATGKPG